MFQDDAREVSLPESYVDDTQFVFCRLFPHYLYSGIIYLVPLLELCCGFPVTLLEPPRIMIPYGKYIFAADIHIHR